MSKTPVGVQEKLPAGRAALLGMQHFMSMFGATVLVPLLLGFSPSVSVFCSGLGTAIYLLVTRGKIPSYLGPSFSFVGPIVAAGAVAGQAGVGSAIVVAGLVFVACALVVKRIGTAWIDRLIPPVVMASIIFVIGCGLASTSVSESFADATPETLVVTFAAFFTVVLCTCFGKKLLSTIPVLVGAAVGYVLACAFGIVDFSSVAQAKWIGLPQFTFPRFDLGAILLVSPIALVVVIEHIGHVFVISEMTGNDYKPILWKSIMGDGLATTAAGFLGAPPATTFAENIGVLNITRVYSTQVFWYAAVAAMVVGGLCPKVGAFISTIPNAVIGGVSIVIFGLIACNALKMIVAEHVDMTAMRNIVVFGGPTIVGVGMMTLSVGIPVGDYSIPGLAVAALLGILLNLVLPSEENGA